MTTTTSTYATRSKETADAVLIVGSMAFDDLELPSVKAKDVVGGAATYAAYAASLFAPVRIVAVVGDDFPRSVLEELTERDVDVSGVEHAKGKTFRWAGRYAANLASRETLDTQLNVFADFKPKLPASYADSPFVLLGNIQPQLQLDVLAQVKAPRFVAADTMNFWISGDRKKLLEVLAKIDTLIINDEELRELAEVHNIKRAAAVVRKLGPKRLIVKRGEYGAMLFDDAGIFFTPAYPLEEEVDPTGAGDSFAGALLGYLAAVGPLDGTCLRKGLRLASAVASFCVEGVGAAKLKAVQRADVMMRVEALRTLTRSTM
ncbi:MAG TPA: PfkB family carbohydrate kinase [Polyangiaceae bacterium]